MDSTLSLLYTSAFSCGIAHKPTRNRHSPHHRKDWLHPAYEWPSVADWGVRHPKPKKRGADRYEPGELTWNIFGEVVRMAEGRDPLMLDRVPERQHNANRSLK